MRQSCTYLIMYTGEQNVPRFYHGSAYVDAINRGYRGSITSKLWREICKNEPDNLKVRILRRFDDRTDAYHAEEDEQRKYALHLSDSNHGRRYLNQHAGGHYSIESCRENGRAQGKQNVRKMHEKIWNDPEFRARKVAFAAEHGKLHVHKMHEKIWNDPEFRKRQANAASAFRTKFNVETKRQHTDQSFTWRHRDGQTFEGTVFEFYDTFGKQMYLGNLQKHAKNIVDNLKVRFTYNWKIVSVHA